mgnify:CR=1 FL=1
MGRQNISDNARVDRSVNMGGYSTLAQKGLSGEYELSVLVSGVHCAGCIQKIESRLAKDEAITKARLNFSTGRLVMGWEGDKERADEFVALVENLGYGVKPYDPRTEADETQKQEKFLLLCLGVAGFAMGNIMLISVGLWSAEGEAMGIATRELFHWLSALIAIPAVLFSGRPFFRSSLKALRGGHTNMDVPISLALVLATSMSVWEIFKHGEHVYFDSAVMLMFFLLIGRYLDFRARKNARSSATDLLSTLSGFANVLGEDGIIQRMAIRDLREDMIVQIAAGEKLPVDGIVERGESTLDTSLVTGETMPREIKAGAQVYAGTLNLSAPITVRVEKAAEDSLLADVVRLMEQAGQGQAAYVQIADRAAKLYTPVVHSLAAITFLGWIFLGGIEWQDALLIAVTVLIITCPCALGLAVPVTQVLATGRLFKKGILVKSGDALERLSKINMAIFDKTGTLTLGKPALQGEYDQGTLQMAASLASQSAHPLSKAIVNAYDGALINIENIEEISGQGLQGIYKGQVVKLGSRKWCGVEGESQSNDLELWYRKGGDEPIRFILQDILRKDAKAVLEKFNEDKVETILLSGDREAVAKDMAAASGIETYYAEKKPTEKFDILEDYKAKGHSVLMVGDGLNDAPVLAAADVSIAPGTAIDMAQNAADIVFMGENLGPVYEAYEIAKLSQKLVRQNFALAIVYNICVIPMAVAGMVTPMIAALAMSGSSLVVIANSFRIKWRA